MIFDCALLELSGTASSSGTSTFGLFRVKPPGMDLDDECIEINPKDFKEWEIDDAAWKFARVCACLALGFGFILSSLALFKLYMPPVSQSIIDLTSAMIQVCLALVYVMWTGEMCDTYDCEYGKGTTLLIVTQVLWLIAGCFTRFMPDGRFERRDEIATNEAQTAEETKRKDTEDQLDQEFAARENEGDVEQQPAKVD
jgi:hypothetical protein